MTDFQKIINRIPQEYQRQKIVNGTLRNTYFFERWVGYSHPVILDKPLSYTETQNRGNLGYMEASLNTSGKIPLIILVESYSVRRDSVEIDEKQLGKNQLGEAYYLFHKRDNRLILEKAVKLEDTFDSKEYLHITFNDKGNIIKSELVWKKWAYSYDYEYEDNGLLRKAIIKNTEGTKILERGKDF